MAEVKIVNPGFYTCIQDLGRWNAAVYGVPQSGAMDTHSARKANLLLGNDAGMAMLEITFSGPQLRFESTHQLCICGAYFEISLNGNKVVNDKPFTVYSGDELKFGKLLKGFRAYLAVSGGLATKEILGSQSQYGILTESFRLKKGDLLPLGEDLGTLSDNPARIQFNDDKLFHTIIEALPGPEYHKLENEQKERLKHHQFIVTPESNRMAIQLKETFDNNLKGINTAPTRPGTVQLTPAGKLLVLMRDCQVSGGYPRVLQLSEMGINTIAQQPPGTSISFQLLVK